MKRPEQALQQAVINFMRHVRKEENGCWIWIGALKENKYGAFQSAIGNYAHRFSYHAFKGEIPDGMFVCHSCDVPSCVNPDHLWIGTAKDNHTDCKNKKRDFKPPKNNWPEIMRQRNHHWQTLSIPQVKEIKVRLANGEKQRPIAESYGVTTDTVGKIYRGERWAHVTA